MHLYGIPDFLEANDAQNDKQKENHADKNEFEEHHQRLGVAAVRMALVIGQVLLRFREFCFVVKREGGEEEFRNRIESCGQNEQNHEGVDDVICDQRRFHEPGPEKQARIAEREGARNEQA